MIHAELVLRLRKKLYVTSNTGTTDTWGMRLLDIKYVH